MPPIGHRRWAIAEGYIPGQSLSQEVQRTRLDSRHPNIALISTVGYCKA